MFSIKKIVSKVKTHVKKAAMLSEQLEPYMLAKERNERAKRRATKIEQQLLKAKQNQMKLTAQLGSALEENQCLQQQLANKPTVPETDASCNTEPKKEAKEVAGLYDNAQPEPAISNKRWSTDTMVDSDYTVVPILDIIEQYTAPKAPLSIGQQISEYRSLSSSPYAPKASSPSNSYNACSSIISRSQFILNAIDKRSANNNKFAGNYSMTLASFYSKALNGAGRQKTYI